MKINKTGIQEVIAAIKLDRHSIKIAKAAAALAARSGKNLRLVHVFEPETVLPVPRDRDWFESYYGMAPGVFDERSFLYHAPESYIDQTGEMQMAKYFEQAESDIVNIAAKLSYFNITINTTVLVGRYPASILELSAAHCGSLIIVGAEKKDAGMFQLRLRETYRLMAGSELPVLVIPDTCEELEFGNDRPIRVLIADDLSVSSLEAIRCFSAIIRNFNLTTDVMHTHVEPLNTATMALSPAYELELWPGVLVKDRLINERHDFIKTRLQNRSTGLRRNIEAMGGKYRLELWHGNVAEELKRAADVHKADVTVFGKHHLIHSRPLSVGQMRYNKMIDLNSAILISPESRTRTNA